MSDYAKLSKQIADLMKQAEKAKKVEVDSVIKTIKKQIRQYSLTAKDLGISGNSSPAGSNPRSKLKSKPAATKSTRKRGSAPVKYMDSMGNTWTGRGKRPLWLEAARANGIDIESFRVDTTSPQKGSSH